MHHVPFDGAVFTWGEQQLNETHRALCYRGCRIRNVTVARLWRLPCEKSATGAVDTGGGKVIKTRRRRGVFRAERRRRRNWAPALHGRHHASERGRAARSVASRNCRSAFCFLFYLVIFVSLVFVRFSLSAPCARRAAARCDASYYSAIIITRRSVCIGNDLITMCAARSGDRYRVGGRFKAAHTLKTKKQKASFNLEM